MAKYDELPGKDHIIRHVPYGKLRRDENEKTIGIEFTAFQLREEDQGNLSTTWLEYTQRSRDEQLIESLKYIRTSRAASAKSALAIAKVEKVKSVCVPRRVRVLHDPETGNPAHAIVTSFPTDEVALLEALASDVWSEFILVGQVDASGKAR